jgi:4,5-DOPA dioxygenase extradiol
MTTATDAMPIAFVGHGSPMVVFDDAKGRELRAWADAMPRPSAILCVSAHWETDAPTLGTTDTRPLIYDFGGFPDQLYRVEYAAPGAPALADRVAELVPGIARQPARGLDHGVWTPLVWMYPDADVPVLQLSLARTAPDQLVDLGRTLAPLAGESVLILGSGNVTHNLGRVDFRERSDTPAWATEFDRWCADRLVAGDAAGLARFLDDAPQPRLVHPTVEHYTPLLVCAGAAEAAGVATEVAFPITGFELASISRRCVQFGRA